jgi:tetratricopeptide (TPR) repeat protein
MRILTLSSSLKSDNNFKIGLGLVIFFAAAEIFSVGYYYISGARARLNAAAAQPSIVAVRTPSAPAATPAPTKTESPAAEVSPPAPSLSDHLLREGVELRDRGDTANALVRLQEALEQDPKNAKILEELAKTYEAMQNVDRSNETWRKIQEMGPSAGASFELADKRLKMGVATPAVAEPGFPGPSRLDVGSSSAAAAGSSEGSTLGITEATVTETPDPDADTNLMLRIGIKKQSKTVIDHTKVKIQVFFYDTIDDKDIKLTDADVTYEWLTPNHDWADTNPEILSVTYLRPKNKVLSSEAALSAAAASVNPGKKGRTNKPPGAESGQRKYLGYIVRIYYHDQLQAVRAEPSRLLKLYPPSPAASP